MSMIIALQSLGLGSLLGGRRQETVCRGRPELLNVPAEYSLISLVPAGAPAEISNPPKKRLDEVSFQNRFGETA